jgi:hypothetical protein
MPLEAPETTKTACSSLFRIKACSIGPFSIEMCGNTGVPMLSGEGPGRKPDTGLAQKRLVANRAAGCGHRGARKAIVTKCKQALNMIELPKSATK